MTTFLDDGDVQILVGDARQVLADLPDQSVHAIATSPPFYNLRDYGTGSWEGGDPACSHERRSTTMNIGFNERWGQGGGEKRQERKSGGQHAGRCPDCGAERTDRQIGLEGTLEEWAASIVEVLREARRVLRDDGTLWLEVGDSYVEKSLVGAPYLLAFALRADGWFWRGSYVWEKPDCMPESIRDRCTTAHSTILHLSKSRRYFFDLDAIREPFSDYSTGGDGGSYGSNADQARTTDGGPRGSTRYLRSRPHQNEGGVQPTLDGEIPEPELRGPDGRRAFHLEAGPNSEQHRDGSRWPSLEGRSPRSVWRITTEANSFGLCPACRTFFPERAPARHCGVGVVAHFAVWPHELVGKIIRCSTAEGETVLDPFAGSGTTGRQARALGRRAILVELSPEYAEIAAHRLSQQALPLLAG